MPLAAFRVLPRPHPARQADLNPIPNPNPNPNPSPSPSPDVVQAGEGGARKLAAPKLKVNRRGGALFPTSYGVDSDKKNPNPKP